MPVVSRSVLAGKVILQYAVRVEHRESNVVAIIPVTHMLNADAEFQCQATGCLPRVVDECRRRLLHHIADGRSVVFAIAAPHAVEKLRDSVEWRSDGRC